MENPMNQETVSAPTQVQSRGGFGGKFAIIVVIVILLVGAYFFFVNNKDSKVVTPSENTELSDDGTSLNQELDSSTSVNIDADLQNIEAEFE